MPFRPVVNPKKLSSHQRFGARYLAPRNSSMGAPHFRPLPTPAVHATLAQAMAGRGTGGIPGTPRPAAAAAAGRPPAPVPGAPGSPTTTPAPQQQQPDPRDYQFFNDSAKILAQHDNTQGDLIAERDTGRASTAKALALLAERKPEDIRAQKEAANKAGLFYSGALGKNLGDVEVNYARSVNDQNDQQSALEASVARRIASNDAQYGDHGLAYNDAFLSSIDRASQRDQDLGVPNPNINFTNLAKLIAAKKRGPGSAAPRVTSSVRQPAAKKPKKPPSYLYLPAAHRRLPNTRTR